MSPRRRSRKSFFISRAAARFTSPVLACLLLPPAAAAWVSVWGLAGSLRLPWDSLWPALAGASSYALFQGFFSKPMGLYVFGHELTHAVAAWLSGYRVKSLKVSPTGGEVVTSDTNLLVALAPYCVPLYTVAVVLVYALARGHGAPEAPPAWCSFGVGFTFAFHAALTAHALRQKQPDLAYGGVFLSLVVIILFNGLVSVLLLKFLFPKAVSLSSFGESWWLLTREGAEAFWNGLSSVSAWAKERVSP